MEAEESTFINSVSLISPVLINQKHGILSGENQGNVNHVEHESANTCKGEKVCITDTTHTIPNNMDVSYNDMTDSVDVVTSFHGQIDGESSAHISNTSHGVDMETSLVIKTENMDVDQYENSTGISPFLCNDDKELLQIENHVIEETTEMLPKSDLSFELDLLNVKMESNNEMEINDFVETKVNNVNINKLRRKRHRKWREHGTIVAKKAPRKVHLKRLKTHKNQHGINTEQPKSPGSSPLLSPMPPPPQSSGPGKNSSQSKRLWECKLCESFHFDGKPMLVSHLLSDHVKVTDPQCRICGAPLLTIGEAIEHIGQHATIQCALCKEENIETFEALEEHLCDKHSNDTMCTICKTEIKPSQDIVGRKDIVSHMIAHQLKTDRRKCPQCSQYHKLPNWRHIRNLKAKYTPVWLNTRPLMQHNIKSGTMECCLCPYICVMDIYAMRTHITNEHYRGFKNSILIQDVSNKLTPHQLAKKRVLAKSIESKRVWRCAMCESPFKQLYDLTSHFFSEHVQRTGPTCVVCDAEITRDEIGIDHILRHTSNLMQCILCKQGDIPTLDALEEHLRERHPSDRFCMTCQKRINDSENIVTHVVEHQRKTPKRKCPTCQGYHVVPAKFKSSSCLLLHNIIRGRLKCPFCGFSCLSFGGSQIMKPHLTSAHGNYFHGVLPPKEKTKKPKNPVAVKEQNRLALLRKKEERVAYTKLQKLLKTFGYGVNLKIPLKEQVLKDAIKLIGNLVARDVQLKKVKGVYMEYRDMLQARCDKLRAEGYKPLVSTLDHGSSNSNANKVEGTKQKPGATRFLIVSTNHDKNAGGTKPSPVTNHVKAGGTTPGGRLVLRNLPAGRLVLHHFLNKNEAAKYLKAIPTVSENSERKGEDILQWAPAISVSRNSPRINEPGVTTNMPSHVMGQANGDNNFVPQNSVRQTEAARHLTPDNNILSKAGTTVSKKKVNKIVTRVSKNKVNKFGITVSKNKVKKTGGATNVETASIETCSKPVLKGLLKEPIPHVMNVMVLKSTGQSGSPGGCKMERISAQVKQCSFCRKWIPAPVFQPYLDMCSKQRLNMGENQVCDSNSDWKDSKQIIGKSSNKCKIDFWKPNKQPSRYPMVQLQDISKVTGFQLQLGKQVKKHSEIGEAGKVQVDKCMVCERWIVGEDAILKHHSFSKLGLCKLKY